MGAQGSVDRRRERRIALHVPIQIRRVEDAASGPVEEGLTNNVSLAGVYFECRAELPLAPNEIVVASVSIPEGPLREFPFTRLAGRGRVVRVDALPAGAESHEAGRPAQAPGGRRQGVALEFGEQLTMLSAIR